MRPITIVVTCLSLAAPLAAQDARQQARTLTIPAYTEAQLYNRAAFLGTSSLVALIAHGKAMGKSPEELGRWLGDFYAPGWGPPNTGVAIRIARGFVLNASATPNAQAVIVTATDTSAVVRARRNYLTYFGTTGVMNGITVAEYERLLELVGERIGAHLGVRISSTKDSAWVTYSVSGRGSAALHQFPRGRFNVTLTAEHGPGATGTFTSTYAPDGTYEVKDAAGATIVQGRFDLWLDQIVVHSETGSVACAGPGTYRFAPQANGDVTFGLLSDSCPGRTRYLLRRHVKA